MLNRIFLIITIIASLGVGYLIKLNFDKYRILNDENFVEVIIIDVPVSCNTSNKSLHAYFRFYHNNKMYSKRLKDKYCNTLNPGDKIFLATNSEQDIFLYKDENVDKNLVSLILLFLFLIFCSFKFYKKF